MENVDVIDKFVKELISAVVKANNNWCIQVEANGYEYVVDVAIDDIVYRNNMLTLKYDGCSNTLRNISLVARNDDIPGMTEYSVENSAIKITFTHSNLD